MTKYKIEWDVKEHFGSGDDGGPLGSHQKVVTSSSQCAPSPCEYTIPHLVKGQPYHIRVFAYNQVRRNSTGHCAESCHVAHDETTNTALGINIPIRS